jgi:hypothetical protein
MWANPNCPQVAARFLDPLVAAPPNSACPALERVLFNTCFHDDRAGAERAFRHFARHPTLRELCMTNRFFYAVTPVPHAAIADVFATASTIAATTATTAAAAAASLFAPLNALDISIDAVSMTPLARMFPALRRLSVNATNRLGGLKRGAFFAAIGSLAALRSLDVEPTYGVKFTQSDLRALQRLAQLRCLRLHHCESAPDLAAADVLHVLCGFRHLRTLFFELYWSPPPDTLAVLGTALPHLRDLTMTHAFYLALAFDRVEQQAKLQGRLPPPLFRNLERLRVSRFDSLGQLNSISSYCHVSHP